ncbi:hypothetical protein [Micromonospora sp. NBC_00421]|uniref:hypothetical protein n=1 Tax=Micromonospora sp. NBC_00421 TaxID=2975976 RepID=UPI002E246889
MSALFDGSVLALINEGGVAADQFGSIFLPDHIEVPALPEVRLRVVVAIARSLAFRVAPDGELGPRPVELTTLGEAVLRHGNPDRYRSATAVEVRDGRYSTPAVKS